MQIEHRMDAKRGNLIWLSDGRTEAAAALDFGIRIVHLSCAGKPNLFYSQPDDLSDGLATEAGWRIYGGHRFWSSPESTRSYYPDNAPVTCELLADGASGLRQRTDPWTGFEKTLILRFLADGPAVGGAYPDEPQSADRTGGRLGRLHAPRRRDGPDPVPRRDGRGIYARPRPVALGPDVARG